MRSALLLGLCLASGCSEEGARPAVAPGPTSLSPGDLDFTSSSPSVPQGVPDQVGVATWYGQALAGHKTASGERFNPNAMTAAHRKLPMGTWVEVRRVDTGTSVRVRINDRGPWGDSRRVIDVSRAAADALGFTRDGTARVELRVVRGPE